MNSQTENRRPLKSRGAGWAKAAASSLARMGASPDLVSAGGIGFALAGGAAFVVSGFAEGPARAIALVVAAAAIQLRLLCNLLDGMVALEHGRGGPLGPVWNELPDRIADALFLISAGYGAAIAGQNSAGMGWAEPVGWTAAILAIMTAYIRELGRALGQPADFSGPCAKPHRMALLTFTAAAAALEALLHRPARVLALGLVLIAALTAITAVRRTLTLAGRLRAGGRASDLGA